MHLPILTDVLVLLGVSLAIVYVSRGVKMPSLLGFLITGIVLGPHGFGVVGRVEEVEQLAEVGVILVLFAIGLEFSLKDLLRMRTSLLVGGTVQVVGVVGAVSAVLVAFGLRPRQAVFLGLIASLSSTAVVLTLLQQRAEIDASHGRASLGILIYQDLMIVPMMLLIPVLGSGGGGIGPALGAFALKALGILALVLALARWVVPQVLDRIVRTRSRDLFLLAIVTICLFVAWGAAEAGLSLALGAFLAGLIISESEYSLQALSDILPLRDLFASFFFISVGMLLDVGLALQAPGVLLGLVGAVIALKWFVGSLAGIALGLPLRAALLTGLALSQVGEFSFLLAEGGLAEGLIDESLFQWVVVAAVGTIGVTPLLVARGDWLAGLVEALPLPARLKSGGVGVDPPAEVTEQQRDHVVVVGFGVNGHNVARAADVAGIPYVVIDMNPGAVRDGRAREVPILYGDATQSPVLEHAGIERARVAIIAISDAAASRRVTALVRRVAPGCRIIARTRYLAEVEPLQRAGADLVIPEELETSVEIVAQVLAAYLVPRREIETFLAEIRAGGYGMLRTPAPVGPGLADLGASLTDVEIATLKVDPSSALAGRRLGDTDLRRLYGINVVAIRRGESLVANPDAHAVIQGGDCLIVLGLAEEISGASALFRGGALDDLAAPS
jgi:CPA2 family monovalent cation:H+ antiporter-2